MTNVRARSHAHPPCVTAHARVVRVRARDGGWRLRLADTGGGLAAAEIRPYRLLPPPSRGARIVIRGPVRYDPEHGWYAIDPVDAWSAARPE